MKPQAHKLTSSQAHKLTSSQAKHSGWASVAMLSLVSVLSLGCGQPLASSSAAVDSGHSVIAVHGISSGNLQSAASGTEAKSVSVELGVIDIRRDSYACIPLSQLGIERAEEIVSLKSSCECVKPELIQFRKTKDSLAPALNIRILPEQIVESEARRPSNLAVEITIGLASGQSRSLTLYFVHTLLHSGSSTNPTTGEKHSLSEVDS